LRASVGKIATRNRKNSYAECSAGIGIGFFGAKKQESRSSDSEKIMTFVVATGTTPRIQLISSHIDADGSLGTFREEIGGIHFSSFADDEVGLSLAIDFAIAQIYGGAERIGISYSGADVVLGTPPETRALSRDNIRFAFMKALALELVRKSTAKSNNNAADITGSEDYEVGPATNKI
jgi:hypothetical protein